MPHEWGMHRGNKLRNGVYGQESNSSLGDINSDTLVDILDIVILVNLLLSQDATDQQMEVADINYDGELSILDLVLIINIALEI